MATKLRRRMFKTARNRLTLWYLTIIMLITISFSFVIFAGVSKVTQNALEGQRRRMERQIIGMETFSGRFSRIDTETLLEIRNRTLHNLLLINISVFVISGALGIFLAEKTLKPIEDMTKKQKRFISDAAHEIKTPLTAIKTNLEVTLRNKNLDLVEARKTMNDVIEDVNNLHLFTNKLLNQSRYQNGTGFIIKEINLKVILKNISQKLLILAENKKEKINLNLQEVKILGKEVQIEELFTNIIENAIKYNKEGKDINITLKKLNEFAITTIEDFGMGISKDDIPNIFEPFYRSDESRHTSSNNGYGIGLAIAKEIAENHNGSISVTSQLQKGTKFTVKLPLTLSP